VSASRAPDPGRNGHDRQDWAALIPFELLSRPDLPDYAKLVYAALQRRCIAKDHCYPSLKTVAAEVGRSPRYVSRGLAALTRAGLIESGWDFNDKRKLIRQRRLVGESDRQIRRSHLAEFVDLPPRRIRRGES
jgi:AraC-like DNA-binding protein